MIKYRSWYCWLDSLEYWIGLPSAVFAFLLTVPVFIFTFLSCMHETNCYNSSTCMSGKSTTIKSDLFYVVFKCRINQLQSCEKLELSVEAQMYNLLSILRMGKLWWLRWTHEFLVPQHLHQRQLDFPLPKWRQSFQLATPLIRYPMISQRRHLLVLSPPLTTLSQRSKVFALLLADIMTESSCCLWKCEILRT